MLEQQMVPPRPIPATTTYGSLGEVKTRGSCGRRPRPVVGDTVLTLVVRFLRDTGGPTISLYRLELVEQDNALRDATTLNLRTRLGQRAGIEHRYSSPMGGFGCRFCSFAQLSRRPTVRLTTRRSAVVSGSTQK